MKFYNRVAEVDINGRIFSYPPFSIEFEMSFHGRGNATSTIRLYNPAKETVSACDDRDEERIASIRLDAGYEEDHGICFTGEIRDYTVKSEGVDKILEITSTDRTSYWQNAYLGRPYKKQKVSQIVRDMCRQVGLRAERVVPGEDIMLEKIVIEYFGTGLVRLGQLSNSTFSLGPITGGILFEPKDGYTRTHEWKVSYENIYSLSRGKDGKTTIKLPFIYKAQKGAFFQIEETEKKYRIISGNHKFSTFQNDTYTECICEEV